MDGYLACLAQKELDKGVKVKHEVVSTMTSIINGTHVLNKKCRVMEYDFILGAYHQRGGHWDIVIVEPKKGAVYFYNPLGETAFQQRRAITSWRNYVNANFPLYRTSWHLETNVHAQQLDSCNCGVYCLMCTWISYALVVDFKLALKTGKICCNAEVVKGSFTRRTTVLEKYWLLLKEKISFAKFVKFVYYTSCISKHQTLLHFRVPLSKTTGFTGGTFVSHRHFLMLSPKRWF